MRDGDPDSTPGRQRPVIPPPREGRRRLRLSRWRLVTAAGVGAALGILGMIEGISVERAFLGGAIVAACLWVFLVFYLQ